jgi:hypothetical protein
MAKADDAHSDSTWRWRCRQRYVVRGVSSYVVRGVSISHSRGLLAVLRRSLLPPTENYASLVKVSIATSSIGETRPQTGTPLLDLVRVPVRASGIHS